MNILDEIIAHKRLEVAACRKKLPVTQLIPTKNRQTGMLLDALRLPGLSVIAEIKQKSPSGGLLRPDLQPLDLAGIYHNGGARAISVLTDGHYFGGSVEIMQTVQKAVTLPILRKEFMIDDYQFYEAAHYDAAAILLIVRILSQPELIHFLQLADQLGLDALVEVHDEAELRRALDSPARIIGINNRNLDTLAISLDVSLRLREHIPADRIVVSESGIKTGADARRLAAAGFDAILVGETLLRQPDPATKLRELTDIK